MKINTLYYLKNLITDIHVASVTPTSRFGVEKVLEKINFPETKLILEYGPGTGNFTTTLLKNMGANSKLIAIEKNSDFCRVLHKSIRDPRFSVFEDSAENVLDILKSCNGSSDPKADYIISGIPFSLLSPKKRKVILKNTHRALKKGGKFLAYQAFFQFHEVLKVPLEELFEDVQAQYYMFSLPPILILEATKRD
jgi:phospholipid N-methyltransferase